MNKKIIMTSMIAIFAGFAAYANTVDIDADGNRLNSNPAVAANCTEPILGTYSGSTDFEAKWQANSIPLRWYSDDERLEVQGEAGTCTYDAGLTVPSSQYQPTKRGYHFRGWTIRTASSGGNSGNVDPSCGLRVAESSITLMGENGYAGYGYGKEITDNTDYCVYLQNDLDYGVMDSSAMPCNEYSPENFSDPVTEEYRTGYNYQYSYSEFSNVGDYEWEVFTNVGKIKGIAACLEEVDEEWGWGTIPGDAISGKGVHGDYAYNCFCKITSFTPTGSNQCTVTNSRWYRTETDFCDYGGCVKECVRYILYRQPLNTNDMWD